MRFLLWVLILSGIFTGLVFPQSSLQTVVGWWKFGEGTGSVVHDYSGNNYDGTVSGGATWTSDGIQLSGNHEHVSFGNSLFQMRSGKWEVVINVQSFSNSGTGYGTIMEKDNYAYGNDGRLLLSPEGKIYWGIDDSVSNTEIYLLSPDTITLNSDINLSAEWGLHGMKLYINNILVASNSFTGPITSTAQSLTVGSVYGGSRSIVGIIKECKVIEYEKGLLAYYPFNGNANDSSGYLNHATPTDCIWGTDRFGNPNSACFFNGRTSVVSSAVGPDFSVTKLTLSAWIRPYQYKPDNPRIIAVGPTGTVQQHYALIWGDTNNVAAGAGRLFFYTVGSGFSEQIPSKTRLVGDTINWHHIAVTFDSIKVTFYFDGLIDTTVAAAGQLQQFTNAILRIGNNYTDNDPFLGDIDEVRIYNRALSVDVIKGVYGNYRQQIRSITDIANDQGGMVRITWDKIYLDATGMAPQVTSYGVWRKIPDGLLGKRSAFKSPFSNLNDTLGALYDYLGTVNTVQSPSYNFVAQTLADSDATGPHDETYLVTAHTADPNVYYLSNPASGHSVAQIRALPLADGWNMVSLPVSVLKTDADAQLPGASSHVFTYEGQYVVKTILTPGVGYWVKYKPVQNVSITGYRFDQIRIPVTTGWNMIGSMSEEVAVSSIHTDPPGIMAGKFFGYKGRYEIANVLSPGSGYWVKVSQFGNLILGDGETQADNLIKIVDDGELPPPPPDQIESTIKEVPTEFTLAQNYPNPANPQTVIQYGLPNDTRVALSVYNMLGERVAVLANENQSAGYHQVTFDGTGLASGVYFYRISAGDYTQTKKLVLMK